MQDSSPNKLYLVVISISPFCVSFLKSQISYGVQSNKKISLFKKPKISYGAQSNKKIEVFSKNRRFLMAHRVIKKNYLEKI